MVLSEPMNGPNDIPESPLFTFSFVLLPKYSSLTLAALVEPLRIANYCDGRNLYGWRYLSPGGTEIPACSGTVIPTEAIAMEDSPGDAIIIGFCESRRLSLASPLDIGCALTIFVVKCGSKCAVKSPAALTIEGGTIYGNDWPQGNA